MHPVAFRLTMVTASATAVAAGGLAYYRTDTLDFRWSAAFMPSKSSKPRRPPTSPKHREAIMRRAITKEEMALLSVLALPNASLAAEYTLMPSPQTIHIGH
jgi:hypothetical protein